MARTKKDRSGDDTVKVKPEDMAAAADSTNSPVAEEPLEKTGRELASERGKARTLDATAKAKPAVIAERVKTAKAKDSKNRDKVRSIDSAPLMTAVRAFMARRNQPIAIAFLHEEKLRGKIRKLTRSQWSAEFEKFIKAPR